MISEVYAAAGELFTTALLEGQQVRLRVNGWSMAPLLKPGDGVLVQAAPLGQLQPGDLVVIRREHDLVTHRLVVRESGYWLTKGDNCRSLDPPAKLGAILGKVVAVERAGKLTSLDSPRWRTTNRWLSRLGRWEAAVFRFSRREREAFFPASDSLQNGAQKGSILARLLAFPFRLLVRLLVI